MPALANTEKTTEKKPELKTTSPVPDSYEPSTSKKAKIDPDYFKYPEATGAYIYFNTLRKGQNAVEWVPQQIDVVESNIPSYTDNNADYPRLQLSSDTRYIPLYTETFENDEVHPEDPWAVPDEVDHLMIFTEDEWNNRANQPSLPVKEETIDPGAEATTTNNLQEVIQLPSSGPEDDLTDVLASLQEDEANPITDDDVAALEAILYSTNDASSMDDQPDESFLDFLLRDD